MASNTADVSVQTALGHAPLVLASAGCLLIALAATRGLPVAEDRL